MKKTGVAILALCTILFLVSCGASVPGEKVTSDYYNHSAGMDGGDSSFPMSDASPGQTEAEPGAELPHPMESTGRKIVYTSYYEIQTTDYEGSIKTLSALCDKYGAYFERSASRGDSLDGRSARSSEFTIRVPVAQYAAFLGETGTVGTVVYSEENNTDVTENYFDTEARLNSAKLREERLLDILANSKDLDDVLALEQALSDVRYEIESLTGSLRKLDSLVSYATVTLSVTETIKIKQTEALPKTLGERLVQSMKNGWTRFTNGLENLIVGVVYYLPAIVIVILITAVVLIVVFASYRKTKRRAVKPQTPPAPDRQDNRQEHDTDAKK